MRTSYEMRSNLDVYEGTSIAIHRNGETHRARNVLIAVLALLYVALILFVWIALPLPHHVSHVAIGVQPAAIMPVQLPPPVQHTSSDTAPQVGWIASPTSTTSTAAEITVMAAVASGSPTRAMRILSSASPVATSSTAPPSPFTSPTPAPSSATSLPPSASPTPAQSSPAPTHSCDRVHSDNSRHHCART